MIEPRRLLELHATDRHTYGEADSRLYALSVGFCADPKDAAELPFVGGVSERKAVPTMATTFARVVLELTKACQLSRPELALHAEQRLEMLGLLRPADDLLITARVTAVYDRGAKGALIHMTADSARAADGTPVCRATYVTLARADGGFGGEPPPPAAPSETGPLGRPDWTWRYATRPDQALLYSLNGDPNPIHVDPAAARRAGFDRPILHGLCTYGIACRALLACCCDYVPSRMRRFDARFSAPVVPGDTLVVDIRRADGGLRFEVRAEERATVVLKHGLCVVDGSTPAERRSVGKEQ